MDLLEPANLIAALGDYLHSGGPVVVAILISTFAMWTLIMERLIYFLTTGRRRARRVWQAWSERGDYASWYAHAMRTRLISEQRLANEQYLGVIRVLILVTPLLGLLGTVTGMIEVFQVITSTGASNARLMASGISKATIPTMTGLAVSLSGILFINLLERYAAQRTAGLADSLAIRAPGETDQGVETTP